MIVAATLAAAWFAASVWHAMTTDQENPKRS